MKYVHPEFARLCFQNEYNWKEYLTQSRKENNLPCFSLFLAEKYP